MARRERVMMLEPFGKGIMGTTLHYAYEIRSDESVFEEIPDMKLPDQMVGLAETIIDKMSGEFQPEKFEDRYENAMIELIRSKQAGLPAPTEKAPAARRDGAPRTRDDARAIWQGHHGHDAPLRLRDQERRVGVRGNPRHEASGSDGRACRDHHR